MEIMRYRDRWVRAVMIALIAGGLLWTAVGVAPVSAATMRHVTTCSGDAAVTGSLPNVVAAARGGDTVVFDLDCPPTSPILLTHTLSPNVDLTIDGTGHSVALDGGCTALCGTDQATNGVRVLLIDPARTITITALTIQHGSVSHDNGGGISNSGTLTVNRSAIVGNGAVLGGGINSDHTLDVINSTIAGNTAEETNGGGLYNDGGMLTLTGSTVASNKGGGVINIGARATVTGTMIADNTPSNTMDVVGAVTSDGHNLIGKTEDYYGWTDSDLIGTTASPLNAHLASLASNGGPTQTMALQLGSPAIGAADPAICRATGTDAMNGVDQRGLPRLASVCDIGAFQVQGTALSATLTGGTIGRIMTLTVKALDGYGAPLAGYSGTVHFTSTDPGAILPADDTFSGAGSGKDNGVREFHVVFRAAGVQTVTITDTRSDTLVTQVSASITAFVRSASPTSGGTAGGNQVTITGAGFGTVPANVAVTIGGGAAPVVSVTNTQLVVTAPAHAGTGTVDVVVTVNGQGTMFANGYTYVTVTTLPPTAPSGPTNGGAAPMPGARPSSAGVGTNVGGSPKPLPTSR